MAGPKAEILTFNSFFKAVLAKESGERGGGGAWDEVGRSPSSTPGSQQPKEQCAGSAGLPLWTLIPEGAGEARRENNKRLHLVAAATECLLSGRASGVWSRVGLDNPREAQVKPCERPLPAPGTSILGGVRRAALRSLNRLGAVRHGRPRDARGWGPRQGISSVLAPS